MSQATVANDVLTLEEAASFLRIPVEVAETSAERGAIPGRQLQGEWRFLRSALEDWLRGSSYKQSLVDQAGALQDDDSLRALRDLICSGRGRSEVE